ncbi:MAG: hypothetical protein FLDDKLPJ_01727 [Phycisphaerae bacterium]|nr:hypothetical protein [Phycisphaerae bacterium]
MPQIAEKAPQQRPHPAPAADDGHALRFDLHRKLRTEDGLMVAAGQQHEAVDRLDLVARQPQLLRASAAVGDDLALAGAVADRNLVLALVRGDLPDDRHPPRHELKHVAVDRVDHRPQHGQRPVRYTRFFHHQARRSWSGRPRRRDTVSKPSEDRERRTLPYGRGSVKKQRRSRIIPHSGLAVTRDSAAGGTSAPAACLRSRSRTSPGADDTS